MINKILKIITFIILVFTNLVLAEEFIIESGDINISEKGNLVKTSNGVKVLSKNGLIIEGKSSIYNKEKIIISVTGDVKVIDKVQKIEIDADKIIYDKSNDLLKSIGKTKLFLKDKYKIDSKDLTYDNKEKIIFTDKKSLIFDNIGNNFSLDAFKFDIIKNQISAKKIQINDNKNNKYYVENSIINLKTNEILGKDIKVEFDNPLFGNENNEPRLRGRSIISDDENTTVYKGVFTTCKKREDDKCPPWSISADVVTHKKKEKLLEYKNAWLEIYDKPIIYFPYFFHPDPTVKRQSGFLFPRFQSSNNSGQSLQIPYYKVLSQNKDLTISPRVFIDNKFLVQNEYRQVQKNSNFISDFSFFRDDSNSKSHIFADFKSSKNQFNQNIKLQYVNGDRYLKSEKLKSPLILDNSVLNTYYSLEKNTKDEYIKLQFEIFEDLTKKKSDRYEYVYPNFEFDKKFNLNNSNILEFNSHGFQKMYDTNIYEGVFVNDLKYSSNNKIFSSGFDSQYKTLFRNVNTSSENSFIYKNEDAAKLFGIFIYDLKLPLIKEDKNFSNFLTPILSARFSPTETTNQNNRDDIVRIDYNRIFSVDRLGNNEFIEGGQSLTLGLEFESKKNTQNLNVLEFEIAQIIRDKENLDLPKINGLNQSRSDLIGNIEFNPSEFFNLGYEFSVDNNLKTTNLHLLKTSFKANNFVTSFEFLEENNNIGINSHLSNTTTFNFNENNNLTFKTSENLNKNITEYYNLIYEYKNDCLAAAIEYDKQYYSDESIKPEENILFSIKIIPFGNIKTPGLSK